MTTTADAGITLSFAERLTVALMRAGMTRQDFAEFVGTTRKTVWTWETLKARPAVGALRVLATESGLPFEWLVPSAEELLPRLDSNQQPADYVFGLLYDVVADAEAILLEQVTR